MIGHFIALTQNTREICQLDSRGEIVPRGEETKFCIELQVQCETDDKTIDVGFVLGFEVELSRLQKLDERQRQISVADVGARETIPRFAKYGPWKLYDFILMPLSGSGPVRLAKVDDQLKQDAELSDAVVDDLRKATQRHRDTAAAYERAKKFLESKLHYLREYPSEARSAARFLADCMRSDGASFMGSWNREKAGRIVDEVDDLIRRRNPNHPNYRAAADSIGGILYMIHPPKFWCKYPPQAHLLSL